MRGFLLSLQPAYKAVTEVIQGKRAIDAQKTRSLNCI